MSVVCTLVEFTTTPPVFVAVVVAVVVAFVFDVGGVVGGGAGGGGCGGGGGGGGTGGISALWRRGRGDGRGNGDHTRGETYFLLEIHRRDKTAKLYWWSVNSDGQVGQPRFREY